MNYFDVIACLNIDFEENILAPDRTRIRTRRVQNLDPDSNSSFQDPDPIFSISETLPDTSRVFTCRNVMPIVLHLFAL